MVAGKKRCRGKNSKGERKKKKMASQTGKMPAASMFAGVK